MGCTYSDPGEDGVHFLALAILGTVDYRSIEFDSWSAVYGGIDMMKTSVTLTHWEIGNIIGALMEVLDRKKSIAEELPEFAPSYEKEIKELESLLSKLDKASIRALGNR